MKLNPILLLPFCFVISIGCQNEIATSDGNSPTSKTENTPAVKTSVTDQIVEVSCGQCQFEMDGDGCDLAIRFGGRSYYVDGSSIDDHGDAHGDDGLCNCIREGKVTGEIKEGRFVATKFEVLPPESEKEKD